MFKARFHPGMERPTWWILNTENGHFVDGAIFHREAEAINEANRLNDLARR